MEILLTLGVFALVSSITPGPNNLMLMSSGATYGVRSTLPHIFGVCLGFTWMVFLVGVGVMQVFDAFPLSYTILKWVSIGYLLYLALKIARSSRPSQVDTSVSRPFSFFQAASFQWVNPKAWTMALSAISVYAPTKDINAVVLVALVFGLVNLPCIFAWTLLGQKLQVFLTSAPKLKMFNYAMATLLALSLYPVLFT